MRLRLLLAVVLLAAFSPAADHPNFSGDWKMDPAKSDFGTMPKPASLVRHIRHEEPTLQLTSEIQSDQGDMKAELKYTTDGKDSINSTPWGEAKSNASWEGSQLVIKTRLEINGTALTSHETWTLSDDGKTTTVDTKVTTPQGELVTKLIMDKR